MNGDPFAPSPPRRGDVLVAMQTAGLSGTFLDAAKADAKNKADAKRSAENSSAVARAAREATRIANLDTSFAPALLGEDGATHGEAARRTAVMAAARSAAFEYGANASVPPRRTRSDVPSNTSSTRVNPALLLLLPLSPRANTLGRTRTRRP